MRADQLIVQRGLAPTRSAAQRLIERGAARWRNAATDAQLTGWALPRKAGEDLPDGCEIEITDDAELRYVSRGGLKLAGALAKCGIDVAGLDCLDAGQSTGGFTDALLQAGAAHVTGIDVGHGQLHPTLAADARVTCFEGVNARNFAGSAFDAIAASRRFGLVTGDLSFISLTLVLPALVPLLAHDGQMRGQLLMLVKPQFELQPAQIGKGGIVRDAKHFATVETRIRAACAELKLKVLGYFESPIAGDGRHGHGNTEFFVWATPAPHLDTPSP